MRKYADLGHVYRTESCEEYPGEWLVYTNGRNEGSFASLNEAIQEAKKRYENVRLEDQISVCWLATNHDPRIGETWFTGFYQHGTIDTWGNYRS